VKLLPAPERARLAAKGAEHAAISRRWSQDGMAPGALVKVEAGVRRYDFSLPVPAEGTCEHRFHTPKGTGTGEKIGVKLPVSQFEVV